MASITVEDVPQTASSKSTAALDRIRALYLHAEREHHLDLPIPQNPEMQIRYRVIDPDEITTDTARSNRDMNLDFVIAACDAILVRGDDGWEPLTSDGDPVRFDETLAEIIGVPSLEHGGTARQVVTRVFATAPSPHLAVANHVIAVTNWMAGEGPVDQERMLGES